MIKNIVMVGAGSVATHMGMSLSDAGYAIKMVYSRTIQSAEELGDHLGCEVTNEISELTNDADMYIFSVKDDALDEVLSQFPYKSQFAVHTSGSIPVDIFKDHGFLDYGVFYPLQTFSKHLKPDFRDIPICIEAKFENRMHDLKQLGYKISNCVNEVNSLQREWLHVSAVFACNFSNHLFSVASDILEKQGMSFELLHPLIKETIRKIQMDDPSHIQTGPAIRKDEKTIQKHLDKLNEYPEYKSLYDFLTKSILSYHSSG